MVWVAGGGWFGTLLGPEGSGSPRTRRPFGGVAVPLRGDGVVVGGLFVLLVVPSFAVLGLRLGVGLVGLLFEICIVDASIN